MSKNKFYLQRFADEADDLNEDAGAEAAEGAQSDKDTEKRYTDEDVDKIVQRKLAAAQKKAAREAAKNSEAEKLKNLSEKEKTEARIAELEKRLAESEAKEQQAAMMAEARTQLADKGLSSLPDTILTHLIAETAEDTQEAVNGFVRAFNDAVDKKVKEALRGTTPRKAGGKPQGMTKEQILSIKDRTLKQQMMKKYRHLF